MTDRQTPDSIAYSIQHIADILTAVSNEVSHVCVVCREPSEPCEVQFFTCASGRTRYYKWVCLFTLCMVPKLASSVQLARNLLQNQFIRFKNIMFTSLCWQRHTKTIYYQEHTSPQSPPCLLLLRTIPTAPKGYKMRRTASTKLLMIHYRRLIAPIICTQRLTPALGIGVTFYLNISMVGAIGSKYCIINQEYGVIILCPAAAAGLSHC